MGLRNILSPAEQQQDSQGMPLAGGSVFLFEPGTSSFITSYKDSGLVNPHMNPVRLSGSGRANIWINRNCDVYIYDRHGDLILSSLSANPDSLESDENSGLIPNGSFEIDTDANGVPDGWTLVNDTGSSNAIDTSKSTDGAQSFRFTSAGPGGGSLTTTNFFPVNDVAVLRVKLDLESSVAGVRNIVRVEFFDISETPISDVDPYDSTANPTSFITQNLVATPPAGARFAKLKLIGCDSSVATPGSTWFDNVSVFYPAAVSGVFDNITIQNNQIITTNLNGDLELGPNGAGSVNVNQSATMSLANTSNALNLGSESPAADPHLALDITGIQGKLTGTTVGITSVGKLGGAVQIGKTDGTATVTLYGTITADGLLTATDGLVAQVSGSTVIEAIAQGAIVSGTLNGDPLVPNAINSKILLYSKDQNQYGMVGFDSSVSIALRNFAENGGLILGTTAIGGGQNLVLTSFTNTFTRLYYAGLQRFATTNGGISVNTPLADTTSLVFCSAGFNGKISANSVAGSAEMFLNGTTGNAAIRQTDVFGTLEDNWIELTRNGAVTLNHNGVQTARTVALASGGMEANNTVTGAGFERVLTTSDLSSGLVISFNGRAGVVVPAGSDYTTNQISETASRVFIPPAEKTKLASYPAGINIGDLGNVTDSGSLEGWTLKKNGSGAWVAVAPLSGSANYTGYAGLYGAQMYFTTEVTNTVPAGLATIVNGDTVNGWFITAVQDCLVNVSTYVSFAFGVPTAPGVGVVALGHVIDPPNTNFYNSLMAGGDSYFANSAGTYTVQCNAQSSIVLLAGEELNVCAIFAFSAADGGTRDARLTVNVQPI